MKRRRVARGHEPSVKLMVWSLSLLAVTTSGFCSAQGIQEALAMTQAMADANTAGLKFLDESTLPRFDKVRVSPRTFENAFRASKAATSATAAGVTYRDYPAAISPLLAEASIVTDLASGEDEKFLAAAYTAAADLYGVAGRYWSYHLREGESPGDLMTIGWTIAGKVLDRANAAYLRNLKAPPPKSKPGAKQKTASKKEQS